MLKCLTAKKKKNKIPFPIASSNIDWEREGPGCHRDLHILAEEKKVIKKGKG